MVVRTHSWFRAHRTWICAAARPRQRSRFLLSCELLRSCCHLILHVHVWSVWTVMSRCVDGLVICWQRVQPLMVFRSRIEKRSMLSFHHLFFHIYCLNLAQTNKSIHFKNIFWLSLYLMIYEGKNPCLMLDDCQWFISLKLYWIMSRN